MKAISVADTSYSVMEFDPMVSAARRKVMAAWFAPGGCGSGARATLLQPAAPAPNATNNIHGINRMSSPFVRTPIFSKNGHCANGAARPPVLRHARVGRPTAGSYTHL